MKEFMRKYTNSARIGIASFYFAVVIIALITIIACAGYAEKDGMLKTSDNGKESVTVSADTIALSDIESLTDAVFNMAGDLSYETQVCLAYVILNRVDNPDYPNSITEVIADMNIYDIRQAEFNLNKTTIPPNFTSPAYILQKQSVDIHNRNLLYNAKEVTSYAVNAAISMSSTDIKLPHDVTIVSQFELDRFEEFTADCVEGLRFYYE